MFTGIIQELGNIRERIPAGKGIRFFVTALLSAKLKIGDSIACDGVCLTVEQPEDSGFFVCAVPETLAKTTLGAWKNGSIVNLESALTPQTPMGGHFVLGHVDGICEVVEVKSLGVAGCEIAVRIPGEFTPYCVYKGSVALSGVSLTIATVENEVLRFAIIPHTLEATNLNAVKPGSNLNFEVDILAKYVERQLALRAPVGAFRETPLQASDIRETDLEKWGYGIP